MFCSNINVSNLEYRPPAQNKSNGRVVSVSTIPGSNRYEDRLRFQMSENETQNLQYAKWNLSQPVPNGDASRRTLELTIESKALLEFLSALDEKNIQMAVSHCQDWFKTSLDEEKIRSMYVPLVKLPEAEEDKPTVRVKVKVGDQYPTNLYLNDQSGPKGQPCIGPPKLENVDLLTKGAQCLVMAETVGLWFMKFQFGMSLTATDIIIIPTRKCTGISAFTLSPAAVYT